MCRGRRKAGSRAALRPARNLDCSPGCQDGAGKALDDTRSTALQAQIQPKLALVAPKVGFNHLLLHGKYLGHVKSSQLCGETSLHMWRVTRLQALPIGPDMVTTQVGVNSSSFNHLNELVRWCL